MRKLLYALIGIVVVLVIVALVAPSFIDWNAHKGEIAAQARAATGRDLTIGGNLSLAVLPTPHVSADDVRLANAPGAASPDMLRVKSLRVSLKLLPLISGRIEVASVEIIEPVIELESFADGRNNWTFGQPDAAPGPATPQRPADGKPDSGGTPIRLQSVRIDNGTIIYRDDKAKTVERVERISAQASAESLNGPFTLAGKLTARAVPMSVDLSVGALDSGRPAPLTLAVALTDTGARIQLAGSVENAQTAPRLKARLKGEGPDLARVLRAVSGDAPAMLAQPFAIEAGLDGSEKALSIDDLSLQLADTRANGSVQATLGDKADVKAALRITLLDLDKLMATPARSTPPQPARATPAAPAPPAAATAAFALPMDIAASVDIAINAIGYKGGQIRNTHIVATLRDGTLRLTEASLQPPGGTVMVSGALAAANGKPQFDGNLNVRSSDLRALMAWLKVDAAGMPGDRLRNAAITGKLKADEAQVQLTDAKIELDGAEMAGGVVVALRERPAIGLSLSIDQFNADAYVPPDQPPPARTAPAGAASSAAQPQPPNAAPLAALKDFDANLALRVGALTYRKTAVRGIALDASLVNGALTIKDASVRDLAGARANVAGTLAGFDGFPTFKGTVALEAQDTAGLLRVAGLADAADQAKALGRVALNARTDTSADRLHIDADLDAAGGKATIAGNIAQYDTDPRVDLALTVNHPELAQLMRAAGIDSAPKKRYGAFALTGKVAGGLARLDLDTKMQALGGDVALTGSGLQFAPTPRGEFSLHANHPSFAQFMRSLDEEFLPSNDRMGAVSVALNVKADDKAVVLKPLDVKLGPATLAGEANLALTGDRPKLVASLNAGEINADWFLPPVAVAVPRPVTPGSAPAAQGGAPWSREPLDTSALAALDADVKFNAKSVTYRGIRIDDLKLVAALADRVLDVAELNGRMLDGMFDAKAKVSAQDIPTLQTSVNVTRANVAKALLETSDLDIASGTLDFTLQAAGAGRSEYELVSALNGNAKLDVKNGEIKGFDLSAVSDRLKHINRPTDLIGLLQSGMTGGSTKFTSLGGTFQINKGVLHTNDLKLVAQAGEGNGKGNINLPAWTMDMDTEFRLTEHRNAPPFGMRLRGPLDNPSKTFLVENIQSWLVQRGAGELLRRAVPGLQQQQPQQPQQPQTQQQEPRQNRPEDMLRGLLDGLKR